MHPGYFHLAEAYGNLNEKFPNAELVTTNSFFLGTFAGITDDKISHIRSTVDKFFEKTQEMVN